ncbi:MAG: hypothetical protein EAX95_00395 [Candidatus Thorarchaeota archaeon]|nr:hypothetical protein [Candidatus Thorarchaeota archaeon]
MKRKILVLIVTLLLAGSLLYISVIGPSQQESTEFQIRESSSALESGAVTLALTNLEDTNLTIKFESGTHLCSIDVVLYEPATASSAFDFDLLSDPNRIQFEGLARIKSLDIVLATSRDYTIIVARGCTNLDSSIFIANGARIATGLYYYASGELTFNIAESASYIRGEYILGEGGIDVCDIYVNLQDDLVGRIYMGGSSINILENVGWYSTSLPGEYETDSSSEDVDITLYATEINARLFD